MPASDFFEQHAMTFQASDLQRDFSAKLGMIAIGLWLSGLWTAPQETVVGDFGQLSPQNNECCVHYAQMPLHKLVLVSLEMQIAWTGTRQAVRCEQRAHRRTATSQVPFVIHSNNIIWNA